MESDIDLIRATVASDDVGGTPQYIEHNHQSKVTFNLYGIRLPDRFKGLPRKWNFLIIREKKKELSIEEKTAVSDFAVHKIDELSKNNRTPLVIISAAPALHLKDNLPPTPKSNWFYISSDNLLLGRKSNPKMNRSIRLMRAIRSKLNKDEITARFFSPYEPNVPASGWKFFGRQKEINTLRYDQSNYFVTGARKIGKTSLLRELEILLKQDGKRVLFFDVQNCQNQSQVIQQIGATLHARELAKVKQVTQKLGSQFFESVIKRLIHQSKGDRETVLIIDELGNAIYRDQRDDWRIMGVLRRYSHAGSIRVIASGFQEFSRKQYNEYGGPFVNFGETLKLSVLSKKEIEEFMIEPLSIWGRIEGDHRSQLLKLIRDYFGSHPLILQYLGRYLFTQILKSNTRDQVLLIAKELVDKGVRGGEIDTLDDIFSSPVRQIFLDMNSNVCRYLFLAFCHEQDVIFNAVLTDDWVDERLRSIGFLTDFDQRRYLLEGMEMRGLIYSDSSLLRYKIASPIIYFYLRKMVDSLDNLLEKYRVSIKETELTL